VLTPQKFHNYDLDTDIFNHSNLIYWQISLPGLDGWDNVSCTGTNFVVRAKAAAQARAPRPASALHAGACCRHAPARIMSTCRVVHHTSIEEDPAGRHECRPERLERRQKLKPESNPKSEGLIRTRRRRRAGSRPTRWARTWRWRWRSSRPAGRAPTSRRAPAGPARAVGITPHHTQSYLWPNGRARTQCGAKQGSRCSCRADASGRQAGGGRVASRRP